MTSDFVCKQPPIFILLLSFCFANNWKGYKVQPCCSHPETVQRFTRILSWKDTQDSGGTWCNFADFCGVAPHLHLRKQQS